MKKLREILLKKENIIRSIFCVVFTLLILGFIVLLDSSEDTRAKFLMAVIFGLKTIGWIAMIITFWVIGNMGYNRILKTWMDYLVKGKTPTKN